MKKHAIIPIFIPHLGCPHACIFCDQKQITARSKAPSKDEVISFIETWLTTLSDVETVEIAFYGGSFTAIPISMQKDYLEISKSYKDQGKIKKIHMSTRPDAIDNEILDILNDYSVDTVELGVQSFDEKVLNLSRRGHSAVMVYEAAEKIKNRGIELGIQLMIGLPGDSMESCIYSANETVKLSPSLARLYPTLVLPDTELYDDYLRGSYTPLSRKEAVKRTAEMYKILTDAGIYIMRIGLKSTDIISSARLGEVNKGTYHPAFRQLVEDEIARERVSFLLDKFIQDKSKNDSLIVKIKCNPTWASSISGHAGENKAYFKEKYPNITIIQISDQNLAPGQFEIESVS